MYDPLVDGGYGGHEHAVERAAHNGQGKLVNVALERGARPNPQVCHYCLVTEENVVLWPNSHTGLGQAEGRAHAGPRLGPWTGPWVAKGVAFRAPQDGREVPARGPGSQG